MSTDQVNLTSVTRKDVAAVVRPLLGEAVSGDATFIRQARGHWELAVIDGLGHGEQAAVAAAAVRDQLERDDWNDLPLLVQRCDAAARSTRGVVLALVRVEIATGRCQHAAIGDVDVVSGGGARRIAPLARPGIVGTGVQPPRVTRWTLERGDVVVIHSDGISRSFDLEHIAADNAEQSALMLLAAYGKPHDDAGCVVMHFDA